MGLRAHIKLIKENNMDSDQTTLNKTTGAISVLRAARSRVTSIQGRGEAGSVLLLHAKVKQNLLHPYLE